ncbi:MAG: pyrroloquinoline quinone biosynthesis protein E [Paracoccaceae bacterium]
MQGTEAVGADAIGGYRGGFARKMAVAEDIRALGFPLTLNAVMHRRNLDALEETVALAERLGARRLEVACVQVHGWAARNVAQLVPSREQAIAAREIVRAARLRLRGRMVIDFVPPDYLAEFPKACMGGWGSTGLNIAPDGTVLPCHAAQTIPGMEFENIATTPMREIWEQSSSFNAYRGDAWMQDPCDTCERKAIDHGGCRCQAAALAGDAAATDPVCSKSPRKSDIAALAAQGDPDAPFTHRIAVR